MSFRGVIKHINIIAKQYLFIGILLSGVLYSQDPPPEFEFNISIYQSFYFFLTAGIDGESLVENEDWVGAFNGQTCVGARKWDISLCMSGVCEVPAMGYDGNDWTVGYMMTNDIPSFKVFEDLTSNFYDVQVVSDEVPWGDPPSFPFLAYIESISVVRDCHDVLGGHVFDTDGDSVCDDDEVVGCQDDTACDFNAAATDDGICNEIPTACDTCSGENDGSGSVVINGALDEIRIWNL